MSYKITFIRGDGTGPELAEATRRCVEATGVDVEWDWQDAGEDVFKETGDPLPQAVIDSIRKNKVAIKSPITTPVGTGFRSVNVLLRKELDCYQNVRPAKTYKGVKAIFNNLDLVIFRENTDDLYVGVEFEKGRPDTMNLIEEFKRLNKDAKHILPDSAISIKPISEFRSERIVRAAFEYAKKYGRKKVTAVHKANIMKCTDGLFLEVARKVAEKYPAIQFQDVIVDNMCMQLVTKPQEYDVLVLPNLYGDIISDLCAGLVGGLGVAPGANIGDQYAVFEAVHGSAPKYKGLNKVNPTAMILSAVMMLRHLKEDAAADKLEKATAAVIAEGKSVTYDLKPTKDDPTAVGTSHMADAIIQKLKAIG